MNDPSGYEPATRTNQPPRAGLEAMIEAARAAMEQAYAPYSGFSVGACVRTDDGRLFAGANAENAAYPLGQCAEASAIGAMVSGGGRRIVETVVIARGDGLCTPCGGCRQRLREFSRPDMAIHVCGPEGLRQSFTLDELLPVSFGPHTLDPPTP